MVEIALGTALAAIGAGVAIGFAGLGSGLGQGMAAAGSVGAVAEDTRNSGYLWVLGCDLIISILRIIRWRKTITY